MIGYVKGKVLNIDGNLVLIENGGIGYEITCSAEVLQKLTDNGEGEVYTYLAVREDGVFLYGFISREEKQMFLKLITVSGVGPKMGITVLSNMKLVDLARVIATSDVKALSSVKGLGKKTAERIILELREKMVEETATLEQTSKSGEEKFELSGDNGDAVIALMSLGFTNKESVTAVKEAKEQGAKTIEQLIAYAIKNIR